jgi:hypothetical protein
MQYSQFGVIPPRRRFHDLQKEEEALGSFIASTKVGALCCPYAKGPFPYPHTGGQPRPPWIALDLSLNLSPSPKQLLLELLLGRALERNQQPYEEAAGKGWGSEVACRDEKLASALQVD